MPSNKETEPFFFAVKVENFEQYGGNATLIARKSAVVRTMLQFEVPTECQYRTSKGTA